MRFNSILWLTIVCWWAPVAAQAQNANAAEGDIRRVVEAAYIQGVFVQRDAAAVRTGFHPSFVMSVFDDDAVIATSLDMWLDRMRLDGEPSGDDVRADFERVDVTGNTAHVKLQVFFNGTHTYTDYLGLYRFADGWKIVNKVFASHD